MATSKASTENQVNFQTSGVLDEETARSELYGLLAGVFYASPATELLAQIRVAATDTPAAGAFRRALAQLCGCCPINDGSSHS